VVLCSDNGPVLDDGYKDGAVEKLNGHKPAGSFRGTKGTAFEGGTRTPFVVWGPGRVAPGVSDEIVSTIDFSASFAALLGTPLGADTCGDSFDVLGALLGKPGAKGRDHIVTQNNNANHLGLRDGDWKLIRQQAGPKSDPKYLLFNLSNDPGETTDVAALQTDVRERLKAKLAAVKTNPTSRPAVR
jgi:arylsulfatase A-like enzyme